MVSSDMLSQDEIDALLRGTDDVGANDEQDEEMNVEDYLSTMEQDALGEIGNISFGSSATALSTLLNQKVEITTPTVSIISQAQLAEEFPHPYVAIEVSYTDGFTGSNLLVIKQDDAAIIADLMLGGNGLNPADLLGEIQLSAVQEAMNQMMGSSATSMSTIFGKRVDISPPSIDMLNMKQGEGTDKIPQNDPLIKVSFRLKVGELIDSSIMQLLPLEFGKSLVEELLNPGGSTSQPATQAVEIEQPEVQTQPATRQEPAAMNYEQQVGATTPYAMPNEMYQQQAMPYGEPAMNQGQWQQPQQPYYQPYNQAYGQVQAQQASPQHYGAPLQGGGQPVVQPAVFSSFEQPHLQEAEAKNLNMLLDIPLQVTVELGRTKRSVKEILELSSGSIIELDKLAGEPVDILVNERLIAKGEVVVIDENFGVRVTDIISQSDRIKKLR